MALLNPKMEAITTKATIPYRPPDPEPPKSPYRASTKQLYKQYINSQLLKACALLATSEPAQALEHVEKAFLLAEEKNLFYEISKCYLYRGLCFMEMKRWREARIALVRGVNVRGWDGRVEGLMREAQEYFEEEMREKRRQRGKEVV